jgi:hypothetical protein
MSNRHSKFEGVLPVTRTIDLIVSEKRSLARATVVKGNHDGCFTLQLDYWANEENIKDNEGYINIRWTKSDLQRMINMLELAEGMISNKNEKNTKNEQSNASNLKVGDEFIAVIRELVQLSLLTGTNVVDHLRAVRVEVIDGTVVPTEQYVQEYNAYIEQLEAAAAKLQEEMQAQEALDDAPAN